MMVEGVESRGISMLAWSGLALVASFRGAQLSLIRSCQHDRHPLQYKYCRIPPKAIYARTPVNGLEALHVPD